jgi:xylulokinase
MNPRARGAYVGLTLHHDRADLARAAMEGVVFAMKDSLEVLKEMNVPCDYAVAAGGGARSDVWLQMQADIFEMDVYRSATKEQACLGAAITAAVGVGLFNNFEEACDVCVAPALEVFSPLEGNMAIYRQMYPIFKDLYTANSPIFDRISAMRH